MTPQMNLEDLEKRAYRAFFQDGLLDIAIGLVLLVSYLGQTGLDPLPDVVRIPLSLVLFLLPALLLVLAQRWITTPRLGRVRFRPERRQRRKTGLLFIGAIVTISWAISLYFMFARQDVPRGLAVAVPYLIGLGTPLVVGIAAYFMDFPRLAVLGAIIGLSILLRELLDERLWLLVGAGLALVMGLSLLGQFLRTHPPVEAPHE